jgi:cardiolipin synthase
MVIFRDLMIMSAVILAWLMGRPMPINPLNISKLNTTMQICFACGVLAAKAFGFGFGLWFMPALAATGVLTIVSATAYLLNWLHYMSRHE